MSGSPLNTPTAKKRVRADLALLSVTLVWGATFVMVKEAIRSMGPMAFLAVRFAGALVLMVAASPRGASRVDRPTLSAGAGIGVFLFLGYAFQTVGLKYTTASKAGFITGLAVIIVPILSAILLRRPPSAPAAVGAAVATIGLAAMSLERGQAPNAGDVLMLLCALSFAFQITLVGKYSPQVDPAALTAVEIATVAILSGALSPVLGEPPPRFTPQVIEALVVTGALATTVAFFIQSAVQRFTTPTHAALIFTMEPVFAAVFAYTVGGEVVTPRVLVGGALILGGMVLSELRLPGRPSPGAKGEGPLAGARVP